MTADTNNLVESSTPDGDAAARMPFSRDDIKRIYRMIDRLKQSADENGYEDMSQAGSYEWACEQISEELDQMFPQIVDEMNEEFRAECQALAGRFNELQANQSVHLVYVEANATFRLGRHMMPKSEVEKVIRNIERVQPPASSEGRATTLNECSPR